MKKLFLTVIVVCMIFIVAGCDKKETFHFEANAQGALSPNENPGGSFDYNIAGNAEGKVNVTGYAYVEERTNIDDDETFKYVLFKITKSSSDNFMEFLGLLNGNSYVGEEAIGLGCLNNDVISYINASDEFGDKGTSFELTAEDTAKIINSTADKPIKLKLEKYKLTNGGSGYNCSSLITKVTVK